MTQWANLSQGALISLKPIRVTILTSLGFRINQPIHFNLLEGEP